MTDRWGFYFSTVDGKPSSLNVNLGRFDAAPDAARPWLGTLVIRMKETNEHGFPTAAEYQRITVVEDRLFSHMHDHASAIFVGQVTGGGTRQIVFYAPEEESLRSAMASVAEEVPDYEILTPWVENDAEWKYYREFLYPGKEDLQSIDNREAVAGLQRYGDDLSRPRAVTHWAYFAQPADRDAFAEAMRADGFQIENAEDGSGERPFGVEIEREDRVDYRSIDKVTMPLYRAALRHNGRYDGWECPVIAVQSDEEAG